MFPESRPLPFHGRRSHQSGAGLVMAIFLITVMALIVTTMAQLQQTTGEAEALDIQSTRAYYAAESGAQLAMTLQEEGEGCGFGSRTFDGFSNGLRDCKADVRCTDLNSQEKVFRIQSHGQCGSGADLASRTVEVLAR
ncbi:MAG: hypothetical protein GWN58_45770 [Anaerolineae bacterium]|nr:hypothetical protein [Anaerolineae bacterium]